MTSAIKSLGALVLVTALFCGCGKETAKAPPVDYHAFDTAPPEIKQIWDGAMAATTNNDPAAAITMLRMLSRQPIDQEKQRTVAGAVALNNVKLRQRAKSGDAEAIKAMGILGISAEGQ